MPGNPGFGFLGKKAWVQASALRSCPIMSERSKAVRNRNISRLSQEFLVLEFLAEMLIWKFLLCVAVLQSIISNPA
ncbi:hypothetical protein HMPREF9104_01794 [Lentilactobacillus kisonensis F0435]|uniref:Uncharacterized protein n=1 Tax=Lentilactobacillus kisonensis F0435 TaxID=797516 RepID=H1LGR6_9LACO|nr:hypothetical protein HMPREF9104_01794 [Lentilactobacillus kisonensis F0435]